MGQPLPVDGTAPVTVKLNGRQLRLLREALAVRRSTACRIGRMDEVADVERLQDLLEGGR